MTTNTTSDSQEEKTSKMDEDEGANAESSSTGSSDGKEGGSGSGGYSADCSASDQSSDENGKKNGSSRGAASEQGAVVDMDNDDEDDDDEAASTSDSKKQPPSGKPRDEALRDEPPSREDSKRSHRTTKFLNGEQDVASAAGQSKTASAASSGRSSAALPLSLDKMDLESILQYDPKKEIEEFANDPVFKQKQPVQWNGIRIAHPMDPRIDLSTVGHVRTQSVPLQHADGKSDEIDYGSLASVEKYRQLMEIVRPFFQPYGVALPLAPPQGVDLEELNQNSGSSEGFTSFFTTTHTSAGGTTTSGSKGSTSTEANKKPAALSTHNEDEMHSDDASMAVLARAKKKHQKKRQGSSNEESSANQSSSDRKVRIQQPHDPDRERMRPPEPQQGNDTSNSSSSASMPRLENAVDNDRVPPRIVTDMSSNPATDSNVGNSSTSATNSGSNQGSSGSGNDGKGSSEELANNEDISGESPEGSDSAENVAGAEVARRGQGALRQADVLGGSSDHALLDDPMDEDTSEAVRERKILDKKRKRIEMRREYEAQQQFESSESSRNSRQSDTLFVPGRPVTLDQVMMVSQIPRLVIQSMPPFLVVHANAAYARLTGLGSHQIVGQPVATLMAVDQGGDDADAGATTMRKPPVGIDYVVATSGLGHTLSVLVTISKAQRVVGRNVSFSKGVDERNVNESGSKDSSLTNSIEEGESKALRCQVSIAPIVSTAALIDSTSMAPDRDESPIATTKRRKHKSLPEDIRRKEARQYITHYVLQIADHPDKKDDSMESLSSNSTSVEAGLQGLSKDQLRQQRKASRAQGSDGIASESSEAKEAVVAVA